MRQRESKNNPKIDDREEDREEWEIDTKNKYTHTQKGRTSDRVKELQKLNKNSHK